MPRLALVTDSTSGLIGPALAGLGITVVPLHVIFGDEDLTEGVDITPLEVAERLRKEPRVSTSRPSPRAFLQVYESLAAQGVSRILSMHLSAQLSGTCEAATLAARDAPVPVRVVDSGLVGGGLGLAALGAARELAALSDDAADDESAEAGVEQIAARLLGAATSTVTLFYVHTLEFLRRGGRIGAASAFLGGALGVKPLLELADGHIEPVEKLRTQGRALARLHDIGLERVREAGVPLRVVVHHVDAAARAQAFAETLAADLLAIDALIGQPEVVPLPAVLAAHVGPGALGAVLVPGAHEPLAPHV
ncbi:MAG: DegV family protein [Dermatophilus congolensis]|nr:DegV family protein [Dermatophilus congolensis]